MAVHGIFNISELSKFLSTNLLLEDLTWSLNEPDGTLKSEKLRMIATRRSLTFV